MPNELPDEMCDVIMDEWLDLDAEAQALEQDLGDLMDSQLYQADDGIIQGYQDEIDNTTAELEAVNEAKKEKLDEMTDGHCYGVDEEDDDD